jgi:hypothetical protein
MTKSLLISAIMFFSLNCEHKETFFPDKRNVLSTEFSSFDNFFPIATLDLTSEGIKDKIHIMYVSFDPDIDHYKPFHNNGNIDEFSFNIVDNGLYQSTFDKSALVIGKEFEKYFKEGQKKYLKAKNAKEGSILIDVLGEPEWWQQDKTPLNSRGERMKFICQVDINEVFNDDCRLYVFYDKEDKKVTYIYQRT